jgi:hypothetical protein
VEILWTPFSAVPGMAVPGMMTPGMPASESEPDTPAGTDTLMMMAVVVTPL